MKRSLEWYRSQLRGKRCRWCGESLEDLPIEHYPHPSGWEVEGYNGRQWLYVVCPKCGYQWALWKLGIPGRRWP